MSRSLDKEYDTLILDCPPGISLLSESVLRAADALIVPLLHTPLSVRMLEQLVEFIGQHEWADLKLLPVFSMVDRRKSLHHEVIEATRKQFRQVLATEVPYSSEIERITLRRAPLNSYAPGSEQGQVYQALWDEVKKKLKR
jgi:cellulose biosynthesis protein BcsQ